ncbi:MAG: hypothetical protein J3R72DRAFT_53355 [Linnemannia gamsii]|nr:MAG: hypothetical protein J3R72DRAFT_53355 [Linnemannia gamsii]
MKENGSVRLSRGLEKCERGMKGYSDSKQQRTLSTPATATAGLLDGHWCARVLLLWMWRVGLELVWNTLLLLLLWMLWMRRHRWVRHMGWCLLVVMLLWLLIGRLSLGRTTCSWV